MDQGVARKASSSFAKTSGWSSITKCSDWSTILVFTVGAGVSGHLRGRKANRLDHALFVQLRDLIGRIADPGEDFVGVLPHRRWAAPQGRGL